MFATESHLNNRTNLCVDSKNKFELYYPYNWAIAPKNSTFPYYGETTEIVFSISISDIGELLKNGNISSSLFLDDVVAERVNSFGDTYSIYAGLDVKLLENNQTNIDGILSRELIFFDSGVGNI